MSKQLERYIGFKTASKMLSCERSVAGGLLAMMEPCNPDDLDLEGHFRVVITLGPEPEVTGGE